MTKFILFDCEADGPIPGKYSMLSFGAVALDDLSQTFYVELYPTGEWYKPELYERVGLDRDKLIHEGVHPQDALLSFEQWIKDVSGNDNPNMVADNAGFDWMFICWYFHTYIGRNPLGFSCTSLTSLYKGLVGDMKSSFKHLRKTKHTHHALDDAMGNAEALAFLRDKGMISNL